MKIAAIGVDLSKTSFQIHGVDARGVAVMSKVLKRDQVRDFFTGIRPCKVAMESCASSHYWARQLSELGHTARIMPASYVKPYVKRDKSDKKDAEAICEAMSRPNMTFVPIKSEEQQGVLMLHKCRRLLGHQMIMVRNAMRGHLAEFGHVTHCGKRPLRRLMTEAAQNRTLPGPARIGLHTLDSLLAKQELEMKKIDRTLTAWHKGNVDSSRLATIPGIGYLTATAMVAAVGDFSRFKTARQFASWLGLVPNQNSTGGRTSLGRVSKKGDTYLRSLLFMGAVALSGRAHSRTDAFSLWINRINERKPAKLAYVAIANKLARIIWTISTSGESYRASEFGSHAKM